MAIINLENPEMLGLIIPVIIGGIYLLKKSTKKSLIISRMIVAILLVIALASPYTLNPIVTSDENPDIVLISDETASMELFNGETSTNLYEALTANTPTTLVQLSGEETALGDAIMQYATGDNQIVLVTDGNNNQGADIEEALEFAKDVGTTVYYVEPELESNDLSVQIEGDKTVIVGSDNQFDIVVSQAMEEKISYTYELYVDGDIQRGPITSTSKKIGYQHTFNEEGAHTIKVVITPESSDRDSINNEFYKTVYAISKPQIQTVGLEKRSPLAYSLYNLYNVNPSDDFSDLDGTKAIVIDNMYVNSFSGTDVENLKDYLREGHGIVVVGGEKSYNFGNYLNSTFEEILPVVSKPTKSTGGKYVILVLDLSGTTLTGGTETTTIGRVEQSSPTYPIIIRSAQNIISSKDFEDATVGIVVIGNYRADIPQEMFELIDPQNVELLNQTLDDIVMKNDALAESDLNSALIEAQQMIENNLEDNTEPKSIIIISDGSAGIDLSYYDQQLYTTAEELVDDGFYLNFIHIQSNVNYQIDPSDGEVIAKKFMDAVGGVYIPPVEGVSGVNIDDTYDENIEDSTDNESKGPYSIIVRNKQHFITRNLEISGNITGFNQVTSKPGSDTLITTKTGESILTTWRYGLGRVASLTTDNGLGGENNWATALYSGNNSKMISSTVNWAIGNPREESGAVVEAPDGWFGTPIDIKLTMYDEGIPILKLDGDEVSLSLTGNNVYEATIEPSTIGVHDLSGYPVAVNYAVEYRDVGLNEEFQRQIKQYGGITYDDERTAYASLLEDARDNSQKLVRESVSQKIYFLLAALVIFLGEVILRRLREIQEMKKLQSQIQE